MWIAGRRSSGLASIPILLFHVNLLASNFLCARQRKRSCKMVELLSRVAPHFPSLRWRLPRIRTKEFLGLGTGANVPGLLVPTSGIAQEKVETWQVWRAS